MLGSHDRRGAEVTREEILLLIDEINDPVAAAKLAFQAIEQFSDYQMGDGDSARDVAVAWLAKFGRAP